MYEKIQYRLGFYYECRYGSCGSCAVKINGKLSLAYRTLASKEMLIEPLSNLPIVRDLIVDHTALRDRLVKVRPFLQRERFPEVEPEELALKDFFDIQSFESMYKLPCLRI